MKLPFWPNPLGYRDIDLGLSRVFQLLERLGNPHLKIPPAIHLAGTNGKGSTLSFLKAILEESGLKTHTYTSPHLVNFNERIVLAGAEISDDFLNEILHECKEAAEEKPEIKITYFEGITVAAFLAFSRVPADILLLETGMGGRLDATNVLPKVLCSIITPISFDHQEFLGETLEKIAAEKCGIIKKNCPVVTGKQDEKVLNVIKQKAEELTCDLINYESAIANYDLPLSGAHQGENAATAIAAIKSQKQFSISEEKIISGLKKAFWPARLQKITSGKFFNLLPKNYELYLDGSHNLAGAKTVAEFLKSKKDYQKIMIFSMLKDKDCRGFLNVIKDEIDQLIAVEITDEIKSRKADEINKIASEIGINSQISADIFSAIKLASQNQNQTLIMVCGSLYQAGNFLAQNQ